MYEFSCDYMNWKCEENPKLYHMDEDYKNCLEATLLQNARNYPEKDNIDVKSLRENHTEFTKT